MRIELKEILSIGGPESDDLLEWAGVTTDEDGFIYVTDLKDYSLKKFSPEGLLVHKIGRQGSGPGEFNSPVIVKYGNKKIYVSEIYAMGIHVFNEDLVFQRKIAIPFPAIDFAVSTDEKVIVAGGKIRDGGLVDAGLFIFDRDGKEEESIVLNKDVKLTSLDNMLNMVNFALARDERSFAVANVFVDRLRLLSREGRRMWERQVLGVERVATEKSSLGELPTGTILKSVEFDKNGNIFVLAGSFAKNKSRDVFVFNPSGELLTEFQLPEASHLIYLDDQNNLYSRGDEGITLKKYALTYRAATDS